MKRQEVLECALPRWYPLFDKVTFQTEVLPLPEDVLRYLRSNGSVVLPKECDQDLGTLQSQDEEDSDWADQDGGEEEEDRPSFPEFSALVRDAIRSLGGQVVCKLNWSAPRDATWVAMDNSLRCSDLAQVLLLLKSSQFVRHDLERAFDHCQDEGGDGDSVEFLPALVLRRWEEINPGHEFRCFVLNGRLCAVSQRDATTCYPHVRRERDSVVNDVRTFFREFVLGRFPLDSFAFDVVRSAKDSVRLVDFGPAGFPTDAGLFTWEELREAEDGRRNSDDEDDVVFRCVEDDAGIQPSGMRQYSVPMDMLDLATGRDPEKLIDFLRLQTTEQGGGEEANDENEESG